MEMVAVSQILAGCVIAGPWSINSHQVPYGSTLTHSAKFWEMAIILMACHALGNVYRHMGAPWLSCLRASRAALPRSVPKTEGRDPRVGPLHATHWPGFDTKTASSCMAVAHMATPDSHERLMVGSQQYLPTFVSKSAQRAPRASWTEPLTIGP